MAAADGAELAEFICHKDASPTAHRSFYMLPFVPNHL
jgi:hypothetical protein